jgi:hypothetical protein
VLGIRRRVEDREEGRQRTPSTAVESSHEGKTNKRLSQSSGLKTKGEKEKR